MKTKLTFLALLLLAFVSCSDDKIIDDPIDTVSINMMNNQNGSTWLGNTDIVIDEAHNFSSKSYMISLIDNKKGLGSLDDLMVIGKTKVAAVEPGKIYQAFDERSIKEFPSGKRAVSISYSYYNIYVVSNIIDETITDGTKTVGAKVRYVENDVPDHDLPKGGLYYGKISNNSDVVEIELPTSDFEYIPETKNLQYGNEFNFTKENDKLIVQLTKYLQPQIIDIDIRVKDSYTRVTLEVVN